MNWNVQAFTYGNVRRQVKRETLNHWHGWQTWNLSVRLPDQSWLSDKVTALFEPRHARQYGQVSCSFWTCFFGHRIDRGKMILKWPKKWSHFNQNVWKYRLRNTVTVSFNTTVRQMINCFSDQNVSVKKTDLNCGNLAYLLSLQD